MASYDSTSDYAWLVPPLPTLPKSPLPPFSFPKLPSLILSPPIHFSSPPQSQRKRYNSTNSFLTRKRPLGFRNLHRSSLNLSPYASSPPFPLPSDLLPLILSYLPPSTVRTLSLVSLSFYDLSSSPIYWYNLSLEKWELPRNICFVDKTSLDSFKKLGDGGEKKITKLGSTVDLKYLLTLSPQTLHPHSISSQFFRGSNAKFSRSPTDKNLIHFKGTTGIGDRCVTTSTPFPSSIKKLRNNTLKPLPKIIRALFRDCIEEEREPFVYPYCVQKGVYDVSPRLFCYFEISILPSSSNINENQVPIEEREGERFNSVNGESDECVAVGLSYEGFDCESKMPGWDERSYGYHGDDGGVFYANGDMIRRYGPSFGTGDTIGCGVTFHPHRSIFFTLNGEYLGMAFERVEEGSLYPTIGIDTKAKIRANFGDKQWRFDVDKLWEEGRGVVEEDLRKRPRSYSM